MIEMRINGTPAKIHVTKYRRAMCGEDADIEFEIYDEHANPAPELQAWVNALKGQALMDFYNEVTRKYIRMLAEENL